MERDAASEIPRPGAPEPAAERAADTFSVSTRAELDYWEVDPAWDGECFRSAAQAFRPNGSGEMSRELNVKAGRRACVRLVTIDGGQAQQELDV